MLTGQLGQNQLIHFIQLDSLLYSLKMSEGQPVYSEINLSLRIWGISRKSSEVEAQYLYLKKNFNTDILLRPFRKLGILELST